MIVIFLDLEFLTFLARLEETSICWLLSNYLIDIVMSLSLPILSASVITSIINSL